MSDTVTKPVTVLLRAWRAGDRDAYDELVPMVYEEIRRVAGAYMRRERLDHTLQPTELVSEALLRLAGQDVPDWNDRVHFFAVAARHMRHVLVDHARQRSASKRGGGARAVTLDSQIVGAERPEELVALDDALAALTTFDERKAQVVELHYFGGMAHREIAAALGISEKTVERDLRFAEAWLAQQLGSAG